jgi:hypothetical protein
VREWRGKARRQYEEERGDQGEVEGLASVGPEWTSECRAQGPASRRQEAGIRQAGVRRQAGRQAEGRQTGGHAKGKASRQRECYAMLEDLTHVVKSRAASCMQKLVA